MPKIAIASASALPPAACAWNEIGELQQDGLKVVRVLAQEILADAGILEGARGLAGWLRQRLLDVAAQAHEPGIERGTGDFHLVGGVMPARQGLDSDAGFLRELEQARAELGRALDRAEDALADEDRADRLAQFGEGTDAVADGDVAVDDALAQAAPALRAAGLAERRLEARDLGLGARHAGCGLVEAALHVVVRGGAGKPQRIRRRARLGRECAQVRLRQRELRLEVGRLGGDGDGDVGHRDLLRRLRVAKRAVHEFVARVPTR